MGFGGDEFLCWSQSQASRKPVASSLIPHPTLSGDQIHALYCTATALQCNATYLYSVLDVQCRIPFDQKKKDHYLSPAFLNKTQQRSDIGRYQSPRLKALYRPSLI